MAKLIVMELVLSIDYEICFSSPFTKRKLFEIFVIDNNTLV